MITQKKDRREYQKQYKEENKERLRKSNKKYYEANKEKIREYYLKYNYGVTLNEWELLYKKQQSCCYSCKAPFTSSRDTCVDHCHTTGQVRGLLCRGCNTAIGLLKDNSLLMIETGNYVELHKPTSNIRKRLSRIKRRQAIR